MPSRDAVEINRSYYEEASAGREHYWRLMAAPRHRVQVLLAQLEQLRPGRIVDLGCGNGVLLEEVRAVFPQAQLAGIDLSKNQIALNQKNAGWASWYAANLEVSLDQAPDAAGIGLGAFDAVLATEVIEHLDDPKTLLENAYRLLCPGGHLLLSTQSGPIRETERRVGHRQHFSTIDMEAALREAGFESLRVWNTGFPFHDLSKWLANLKAEATLARFGGADYSWKERMVCLGLRGLFRLNSGSRGAQLFALARRPRSKTS